MTLAPGNRFSVAYKRYALTAMTAVYMLHVLDRWTLLVLLEPIKNDLRLSDSQLGFVTGPAFALFSVSAGLWLSRWADRGNRVTITSLAVAAWATTVMASIFVASYVQLVCARIAAAVGESGVKPPTFSLIGDYFEQPAEKTRALSIYFAGNFLGSVLGLTAAGWLAQTHGWRVALFILGVPGLIMALIFKLTIVEPRSFVKLPAAVRPPWRPIGYIVALLWRQHTCRHLSMALVLLYTIGAGLSPWFGAFLIRSHAMSTAELGLAMGLVFGIGGISGVALGAYLAIHVFANDERRQMKMSGISVALLTPCLLIFLTVPSKLLALIAMVPVAMAFSVFIGPTYALLQRLVPADSRATVVALILVLVNLIGMGVGPQAVGLLSDAFAPALGNDSLRAAMLILSTLAAWSGYHFWRAAATIQKDLRYDLVISESGT
jgi:MFS family permease